jgi:rhamnulokinase
MGLWLLSESIRTWNLRGLGVDLGGVLVAAAALPAGGPRFDPDDPVFLPPGDMPERIVRACRERGEPLPSMDPEVVVRCILDSLADAFAAAIGDAERLSGHPVEFVHIVGGGSQNAVLCQLTADACGRPVLAGPVEATAFGNLVVQARTHGVLQGDLGALRARVRAVTRMHQYLPRAAAARRPWPHRPERVIRADPHGQQDRRQDVLVRHSPRSARTSGKRGGRTWTPLSAREASR